MAQAMDFEILGDGMSFAQAFSKEKCDMAAFATRLI